MKERMGRKERKRKRKKGRKEGRKEGRGEIAAVFFRYADADDRF